ncbi:dihydroxyacetone kinase subunit DhaL [Brachybacterium hainanense]|uniref:Dihydroxyacetone kinase subunit DhaL n=1 Tax=Brachybacterium hainanense TaxID=1541174 RepID=A0ABV6R9V4_9MICO
MTTSLSLEDLTAWLTAFAREVDAQEALLTSLDAAIGDADHGANMVRGTRSVAQSLAAQTPRTASELLLRAGTTLVSSVGGAAGPLYGTFFLRMSREAGAVTELDARGLGAALRAGLEGLVLRGRAEVGDKTLVDALSPAVAAFEGEAAAGGDVAAAAQAAAVAAAAGRDAARMLEARKGRASLLGERSIGHVDPGSASAALLMECLAEAALGSSAAPITRS